MKLVLQACLASFLILIHAASASDEPKKIATSIAIGADATLTAQAAMRARDHHAREVELSSPKGASSFSYSPEEAARIARLTAMQERLKQARAELARKYVIH